MSDSLRESQNSFDVSASPQALDPVLRTAVHIDGSQNAVGAVLLQWQEDEEHPRPVAFMSRKLKGAHYRYDAQNVEAFAAQVALQTWRTLFLGQKFEIYSDHDSQQYLFTKNRRHSESFVCVNSCLISI